MRQPRPTPEPSLLERWRAAGEILLFAVAAVVLVTGPNIATVGKVLARRPAPAAVEKAPRRASPGMMPATGPAAAVPPPALPATARVEHSPAPAAALPADPRASPTAQGSRRSATSAQKPAPSSRASRASGASSAGKPGAPSAEVAKIQHFHSLMDGGIALYEQGWYGPALARFRQAAVVLPSSPYAHLWWGRAAVAAGRSQEARGPLERAIALAPDSDVAQKAQSILQSLD